jgi:hypothetical protein
MVEVVTKPIRFLVLGSLMLFGAGAGCGLNSTTSGASSTCATNTAQLGVYDTSIRRICGCTGVGEISGTAFTGTGSLCTVSPGTVVYFNYIGIQNTHQIVINQEMTFPERNASNSSQVDGYPFNSTGLFTFKDFYTNIQGTIKVQ